MMKDYPYWTESLLISQEMNKTVFDRDYIVNNKDLLAELNQALFENWMEVNRPIRELEESKKWVGINNYCSILSESKNKS